MADHLDEREETDVSESPEAPVGRDYAELGSRVAAVLAAAESAAEEIQAEATRKADALRRRAETEARAEAEDERAKAVAEASKLRRAAIADAEAVRDAAQAAAGRVASEGQRRLGELRTEARALEGKFESAVDDLHELIAQLEAVVRNAAGRPERSEPDADTDPGRELEADLRPAGAFAESVPDAPNGQPSQLQ